MKKITPSRQRNTASQGIALGLVKLGRWEFDRTNKMAVDMSFEDAWRDWQHAGLFPQVSTDIRNGKDGIHVMTHADRAHQVWVLYWETHPKLTIMRRDRDWDPSDPAEINFALGMLDGEIPLSGWQALAADFLERFDR